MTEMQTLVFVSIIVALVIAILIVWSFNFSWGYRNLLNSNATIMKPFSMMYGQDGVTVDCPAGSTINILTARSEVYDPYQECTSSPNSKYLQTMCQADGSLCGNMYGNCENGGNCANTICGPPNNTGVVRSRDVTAFVGQMLNGQQSGTVSWSGVPFPAYFTPSDSRYNQLPQYNGTTGDILNNQGSNPTPGVTSGFSLHGIYACVPSS